MDYFVQIFKFYTVPMPFHDVKNFLTKDHFQANTCRFFYRENMPQFINYSTSQLPFLPDAAQILIVAVSVFLNKILVCSVFNQLY